MRHPITTLMLVVALISGGVLAYNRMRVDIFPSLNTPKIYVFLDYVGMSPDQMEGFIVNELELYFQYVDGIQDIKSRNIQQVALCELSFFPGTDMGQAMAQVVAMSDRAMSWMPKGTLPPMIMRMDAGSVPVGYLVMESEDNLARGDGRPGAEHHPAAGAEKRSRHGRDLAVRPEHAVDRDQRRSAQAPRLQPDPAARRRCPGEGEHRHPGGQHLHQGLDADGRQQRDGRRHPAAGQYPAQAGARTSTSATWRPSRTIPTSLTAMRWSTARKSVYLPIIKKDTGSTLTVVADVHKSMQLFRDAVPKDVTINFEFDESPTVVAAVESVATEGMIGAGLTGLMILLFLRDLRSVLVVVSNIPLALLGSLFGLWLTGNTINIMSLGGMALAIGILVDEATVTIENMHVQMGQTPEDRHGGAARGQRHGRAAAAGLALHPVGVHPGVHHGGPAPVAVHAADPGGRVRHDLVVRALEHVRADHVRLLAQAQGDMARRSAGCSTGCSTVYRQGGGPGSSACAGWWCRAISRRAAWSSGWWGCRSAPSCSRRSIRASSCSGSGRRRARTSS